MDATSPSSVEKLQTRCCIVGGGPAGIMLGFLLARTGVEVLVLEKHGDFLRDFRGDTIHPSTLQVMHELGLLEKLLALPHQKMPRLRVQMGAEEMVIAEFSRLPTRCPYIALMPQWDFLNFLAEQGRRYPAFHLRTQAEVTGLLEEDGRVVGVRAQTPTGTLEVRAELVVGADGRNSRVRDCSGLAVEDIGAPMDGLWMRLSRHPDDPSSTLRFDRGKILVMIDRGDYWQIAFVIHKGAEEEARQKGLEHVRASLLDVAPFLGDRVNELKDWSDLKLLHVRVDRLQRWYRPGLLCIGDAAHAMSPVGGVGINLAIQDAIAAANVLAAPFRNGSVTVKDLARVQDRRLFPTRVTQKFQVFIHKKVIAPVLATPERIELPWLQRRILRSAFFSRLRGRLIGIGVRPEHVKTPDVLN